MSQLKMSSFAILYWFQVQYFYVKIKDENIELKKANWFKSEMVVQWGQF